MKIMKIVPWYLRYFTTIEHSDCFESIVCTLLQQTTGVHLSYCVMDATSCFEQSIKSLLIIFPDHFLSVVTYLVNVRFVCASVTVLVSSYPTMTKATKFFDIKISVEVFIKC